MLNERYSYSCPSLDDPPKVGTVDEDGNIVSAGDVFYAPLEDRVLVPTGEGNLISSECGGGMHMPAIDLDVPAQLVPSSTPGHFHLYIDVPMTWAQYMNLLNAFVIAGIVEPGFFNASFDRGASFLRRPGVKKP